MPQLLSEREHPLHKLAELFLLTIHILAEYLIDCVLNLKSTDVVVVMDEDKLYSNYLLKKIKTLIIW